MKKRNDIIQLKSQMDALLDSFPYNTRIENDPIRFPRRYEDVADREVAGLIAAVFAYGNVSIILKSEDRIFSNMRESPAEFARRWYERASSSDHADIAFVSSFLPDFYYRFNNADDLKTLLWIIGYIRKKRGSLENLFLEGYQNKGKRNAESELTPSPFAAGLEHFSQAFNDLSLESPFQNQRNFTYLFPRPSKGSPCKRLCLYVRWMVRHDKVDPGGWTGVKRSDLIIPLDAHIQRLGKYLGFTSKKNASWRMAEEITAALRKFDPEDPVKYDFALCHLGMSGECPNRFTPEKCRLCVIQDACFRQ